MRLEQPHRPAVTPASRPPRHVGPAAATASRYAPSVLGRDSRTVTAEPETRLAKPYPYGPDAGLIRKVWEYAGVGWELVETYKSPMRMVGRYTSKTKEAIRYRRAEICPAEQNIPVRGVTRTSAGWQVPVIPNPDDRQGRFDPYAFMPSLVFSSREDSLPVVPDLDGDGNLLSDAQAYRHGVVGGAQPLSGMFSVAKKGEYTVLTYSLYYVDNKAGHYHPTDSSTVAVYLKPGRDGRLQPEYVYTNWHHGAGMARWEDIKKDAQGRPMVMVERGSHALRPLGPRETVSEESLVVRGDGRAFLGAKPLPHRMTWTSPQPNVTNARLLDPKTARGALRMEAYFAHHPERRDPYHPIFFGLPRG